VNNSLVMQSPPLVTNNFPIPEETPIATAQVAKVATTKTVAQGAVAIASITIIQGRAKGHNAVQGGGSEGPVEIGSIGRIAWEVASAAEETSHRGRSWEGFG